jgi:cell division protease FtsH
MITVFGMNEKVGQVSFYGLQNDSFLKPYSEETAHLIDEEVRQLVNSQFERAKALLREKREELEVIAQRLLEKEVLTKTDVEKLIGKRPYTQEVVEPEADTPSENGSAKVDEEIEADTTRD